MTLWSHSHWNSKVCVASASYSTPQWTDLPLNGWGTHSIILLALAYFPFWSSPRAHPAHTYKHLYMCVCVWVWVDGSVEGGSMRSHLAMRSPEGREGMQRKKISLLPTFFSSPLSPMITSCLCAITGWHILCLFQIWYCFPGINCNENTTHFIKL